MPLPRTVSWRRTDLDGLGVAHLAVYGDGIRAIVHEVSEGVAVRYEVTLGRDWATRACTVEVLHADGPRDLHLRVDGDGRWSRDGAHVAELDGCRDVDVAATPLTNTFPIRRLGLEVDEMAEAEVVWIGVPDLEVERLGQVYRRLEPEGGLDRYTYRPVGSEHERLLTVDADGLVVDYEDFAVRMR